jgi:hypothetical protein
MRLFRKISRSIRNFFLALTFLFTVGCVSGPVIEGDTPQAHAADAIARVEIVLTKGYRFVADQAAAGVLLKSELKPIVDTLDQAAKLVDEAKTLYSTGVFSGSLDKALNADQILARVDAEIAKRLKERQKVAHVTSDDPDQECLDVFAKFLQTYKMLKHQGWTEERLSEGVTGEPVVVADIKKFIRADMRGDTAEAQKQIKQAFKDCSDFVKKNPEVTL